MSEEIPNLINSAQNLDKTIKPKLLSSVTFQELIQFKEELLKELRDYKSKTTHNVNMEFEKYSQLIEKVNNKMDFIQQEKSSFFLKSEFIEEKNNIFSNISNVKSELKKIITLNETQIKTIQKDLEDSNCRYDKAIVDNLQVPGLVGSGCRFLNLKLYILSNKEELNNAVNLSHQTSMDYKSFKKKTENYISQINEKIKSQDYNLSNRISSKFNELQEKFDGLYKALNEKINSLSNKLNSEIIEINKENEKIHKLISENKKTMKERNEILKDEIIIEIEEMKTKFHKIKKNIVNLTSLLAGKNKGLNKQMVINNFNNMMKNLYKEFNIDQLNIENNTEIINNINPTITEPKSKSLFNSNKKIKSFHSPTKSIIKSNIGSSIKDYIEGKISAVDTKFNSDAFNMKRKQSVKLNNKDLFGFNKEINKNILSTGNINNFNSVKINPRLSLKLNTNSNLFKEIKEISSSFSENPKNLKSEINKKRNTLNIVPTKEEGTNKNNKSSFDLNNRNNKNNINISKKKQETINEEESNKSSSSNESNIKIIEKKKEKDLDNLDINKINQYKSMNLKNGQKIRLSLNKNSKKIDSDTSELSSSTSQKIENSLDSSKFVYNDTKINNENKNLNKISNNSSQIIKNSNNNNDKSINNYNDKTVNNIIQNASFDINKENNKLELNNSIKNNFLMNNETKITEKSLLKKFKENQNINLKQNFNINKIKDNLKNQYNHLSLNNIQKRNELIQISPNQENKKNASIFNTLSNKKENKNNNPLNTQSKYINYISKAIIFQNKDLMIKTTRNKDSNINNNHEREINFSSYDGQKNFFNKNNNNTNNLKEKKLEKKDKEFKINYDDCKNFDKYEKEIYVDNNIFKKIQYIKDEEIIDKPLLLDKTIFKCDKSRGYLESRIIELEFFTKKKFDELVKEIKNFIPIHFNSHLKDYSYKK